MSICVKELEETAKFGISTRTANLKKNLVSKACYKGKYGEGIYVDITRAGLYMESYQATEGQEPVIRRAKALYHVLSNIPIAILDNELIIGSPHSDPYALPVFPEVNTDLLIEALNDGYVPQKDTETAKELVRYWQGKTIAGKVAENLTDWIKEVANTGSSFISNTWRDGIQHCVPNWDYTFANGTKKIKEKIQEKLARTIELINDSQGALLPHLVASRCLFEGMLISLSALDVFSRRFSRLALQMADKESDRARAEELKVLSGIMDGLLSEEPKSFHQSCQGFYFLHLIFNCIDSAAFGSLCRIDQCLYPYYEKDIKNKVINQDKAQELIECLILKVQGLGAFFSQKRRLHFEGNGALPIWTVGGIHEDGTDACNELTEVVLKAARSIRCNQPTISLIYHPRMKNSALVEAIKTVRSGLGYPSFTNADWMVASLMRQGIPLETARNSGVVGCVSVCPVNSCNTTKRLATEVIAAKSLELALNEGKCLVTGRLLGPIEKPAVEFKTYEEVVEAFRKQIAFSIEQTVNLHNLARIFARTDRPNPLASALHRSPLEKGLDVVSYEDYPNNCWINMVGLVNVVNSLAVLKMLVFEEKKYTMADFVKALETNWEGQEAFRQEVINKVPKFGNDNPYVDQIARDIFKMCADISENTKDINGNYWSILAQSVSIYQATASLIGAMPDGKLRGKPVADGGISPDHGSDKEGIFSVFSSVGSVDHTRTKGLLLNQWIAPQMLEGEEGIEWMKSLLTMWHEYNLSQIQFNVVDPSVLRDAQKHPEKYPHLTVRVSGYTANWVKLTRDLQEMILSRTMQER